MQKRLFTMVLGAITTISILYSCTKLDTTTLGSDLLTVDNVNTFADTLEVITTQGIFDAPNGPKYDSTLQAKTDIQYLGSLTDAYGVKTDAVINLQLKPTFFPFYYGNALDTVKGAYTAVGLDSVVLCLSPRVIWGDSTSAAIPQEIEVRAIGDIRFRDKPDSLFGLRYDVNTTGSFINNSTFYITPQSVINKTIYGRQTFKDSVSNQLRIRLSNSFANSLFAQDSTTTGLNNAYRNDSIFRSKFQGFQIKSKASGAGNTLYGFNLADGKTRLEFHFKRRTAAGSKDTVMQAFFMAPIPSTLNGVNASSSVINTITRNFGSSITTGPTNTNAYLQNAPGTFINVKVPGLTAFRNMKDKIVHRAFLQIDQNDGATPSKFSVPPFLYLDLKDTLIANRFKPVYFDLNDRLRYDPDANYLNPLYHPYPSANIDQANFGGGALDRVDAGVGFKRYEINLTRYTQHIIANDYANYEMRVMAPYNYFYPQYLGNQYIIPFYNPLATGSVRVGAGTYPINTAPRRMKFIVIYSKVK